MLSNKSTRTAFRMNAGLAIFIHQTHEKQKRIKLFQLIISSRYIPSGFKYSYIVPIPKLKDCHNKVMKCDDFRGIAISPVISKVLEYCFLEKFQSLITTSDNQFGFKKGIGCHQAMRAIL